MGMTTITTKTTIKETPLNATVATVCYCRRHRLVFHKQGMQVGK
jgi:hypothetical protein